MNLLIAVAFGPTALAMAFLVVIFARAYLADDKRLDRRYRVVAGSLAIGSTGTLLWSFNPLSQSLGGPPLHWILMGVASTLILFSCSLLIGSTAMGGNPRTLRAFLLLAALWVAGCIVTVLLN